MLNHLRKRPLSDISQQQQRAVWKRLSVLIAVLCLYVPSISQAEPPVVSFPQASQQPLPIPRVTLQNQPTQNLIQQVQNTPQSARAVFHLIKEMPQAQEEMEIIQQRSQLVVTRENVKTIAIADPSILEIVQYSPKEFAIVGLALGSTTLTIWFEDLTDPLIYTIKTIRDPNLDYQRKLDYGKLEKRLAVLYPNSKVYLIPMSRKILVRGQARDSNEAAHILATIRGEIINQEGSLFGPQAWGMGGYNTGGYPFGSGGGGGVSGSALVGLGAGYGGLSAWDLAAGFIINELQVPGEFQIALRVRIAELSRSSADNAGVNINALFNNARNAVSSSFAGTQAGSGGLSGTFENGEIGLFLDWLCSNGTAKILAEPAATVLSGRNVQFLSGGEFAVPTVVGVGGAQSTTTNFRGFGTSLLATPTVVDRDNIRISVIAEYSNLVSQNSVGGIPGMRTRRISTVVEMREGQTMALAGLLSSRTTVQVQRFPVLGDVPWVGPLFFTSKAMTQEENELLILITPELVRPMDPHEVPPVPGFDVTKPSCEEFWKYNMTEGRPDTGWYQSPPYGSNTTGVNVDYQHFNPGPGASMYSPVPTNPGPGTGPTYNPMQPMQGPGPYAPPTQINGAPMNGATQYRPTPQSPIQQPMSQRAGRPRVQSQVIQTGSPELRQTNYSTQLGLPRDRQPTRPVNNGYSQD